MNKLSLLISSSMAAFLATGAYAQGQSPNTGGNAPSTKGTAPSGAETPGSRGGSGSGAEMPGLRGGPPGAEREGPRGEGADRTGRPESKDRGDTGKKGGPAKSDKEGSSSGASDKAPGRDANTGKSEKRSKDGADSRPKNGDAETGAAGSKAGNESKSTGSAPQLSGEKRTKVQSAFRSHRSAAVVRDIDIDINVGVTVPRSVTLVAVPEEVVVIVPEYRRYRYFIVDDKVVIVHPDTLAIVDVLVLA